MIRPDYLIGTKNEVFGPGGIQNAVVETLVRTEGPIDAKLIDKNINGNGTYSASAEGADGFKKVVVDVENSYSLSDEGKVVNSGTLVTQTSSSITQNGVVDTTLIDSITVDVPNTYLLSDEGKVVSGGSLVTQTSSTVTENGVVDTTLIDSVTVDVASSGGVVSEGDVNFYDYDGTLVMSYTADDFLELSQIPQNPSHEGLTAQGWNWNLSDAQAYVRKYGMLEIAELGIII